MAAFYTVFGLLFTYLAYNSIEDTVFNIWTIVLTLFAALDFYRLYRIIRFRLSLRKQDKNDESK